MSGKRRGAGGNGRQSSRGKAGEEVEREQREGGASSQGPSQAVDDGHPECWFSTDSILRMSLKCYIRRMFGETANKLLCTHNCPGHGGRGDCGSSRTLGAWLVSGSETMPN